MQGLPQLMYLGMHALRKKEFHIGNRHFNDKARNEEWVPWPSTETKARAKTLLHH
jgi:hypothetical protein